MDKEKNSKKYGLIYIFMYLLYIVILLPKTIQMILIVILFIYLLKKNEYKIWQDKTGFIFSLVGIIQLIAILLNAYNNDDSSRLMAALNTAGLWILGGIFYSFIKNNGLDKEKVNKAMFINMCILIGLSLLMIFFIRLGKTNITIMSRSLMRNDWLYGEHSYRLRAFLLYDTLVPMLYFTIFPFAFEYVKEHKNNLFTIIFVTLSIMPVYMSKSRIAIVLVIILYLFILNKLLTNLFSKRERFLIITILVLIGVTVCMFNYKEIYNIVFDLINARNGSTSTREVIYETSIKTVLESSPIIGCGIKEMIGSYPLGSHSTYIGLLYKVGIIGFLVALLSFTKIFKEIKKSKKYYNNISMFCLSIMFITEDIDGENWLFILFVILYGYVSYNSQKNLK